MMKQKVNILFIGLLCLSCSLKAQNCADDYNDAVLYDRCVNVNPPVSPSEALIVDAYNNVWQNTTNTGIVASKMGLGGSPPQAAIQCGYFTLIFEDVESNSGLGFDDNTQQNICNGFSTLAEARQATACAVFEYISDVIVPFDVNIAPTVYFQASENDGQGALGTALYDNTQVTGNVTNGLLGYYINTGSDFNTSVPDAVITIDFGYNLYDCPDCPNGVGGYDLYTIILHEATHALGFASFMQSDGSSNFGTNTYTDFDQFLFASETNISSNTSLLDNNNFQGTANDLLNNTCMFHDANNTEAQPLFSPAAWLDGSSLKHFDGSRSNFDYVMHPYASLGSTRRRWTMPEIETLRSLGYTLNSNIPTNNYPIGTMDLGTATAGQEICFNILNNDTDAEGNDIDVSTTCNYDCEIAGTETIININTAGETSIDEETGYFCFTPDDTYMGTALFKYCPTDHNYDNVSDLVNTDNCTTISVQVQNDLGYCPDDPCNLICNGSFEFGLDPCAITLDGGTFNANNVPNCIGNWCPFFSSPDYFIENINNNCVTTEFGIPFSAINFNSNASLNNGAGVPSIDGSRYAGFQQKCNPANSYIEAWYTPLAKSLIQGNNYQLTFQVFPWQIANQSSILPSLQVGFSQGLPNNAGLPTNNYNGFYMNTVDNLTVDAWQPITINFTVNDPATAMIDIDHFVIHPSAINGCDPNHDFIFYYYIDNFRLIDITQPQINITKTVVGNDNVVAGSTVNFLITVTNMENTPVSNVALQDILPTGLTLLNGGFNGTDGLNTTINSLTANGNAGSSQTFTISATVDANLAEGTVLNNCVIANIEDCVVNCQQIAQQENCAAVTVVGGTNIGVSKTADAEFVLNGDNLVYTINIVNTGPADAYNIVLSDVLPSEVTYIIHQFSNTNNSYDATNGQINIPVLLAGQSETLAITTQVVANDCSFIQNCIDFVSMDEHDISPEDNQSCVDVYVGAEVETDSDELCCAFQALADGDYIVEDDYIVTSNGFIPNWTTTNNEIDNSGLPIGIWGDLIIPSGIDLTITNMTFHFGPYGRVIVENGASLILDGCVLTGNEHCQTMWQGIQVYGDGYVPNPNIERGSLRLRNNTTIEHALIGVATMRIPLLPIENMALINFNSFQDWQSVSSIALPQLWDFPAILQNSAGALTVESATFNDCLQGINTSLSRLSYSINAATFQSNGNLRYPLTAVTQTEAGINSVLCSALRITNSDFIQVNYGIRTTEVGSLSVTSNNTFTTNNIGISARNLSNNIYQVSRIINNDFTNCLIGIQTDAQSAACIEDNTITGIFGDQIGVYLRGANADVLNNDISSQKFGIIMTDNTQDGTLIAGNETNADPANNLLMSTPIMSRGDNLGVEITCNDFLNYSNVGLDIRTWTATNDPAQLADQGNCEANAPAANNFNAANNNVVDIYRDGTAINDFTYEDVPSIITNLTVIDNSTTNSINTVNCNEINIEIYCNEQGFFPLADINDITDNIKKNQELSKHLRSLIAAEDSVAALALIYDYESEMSERKRLENEIAENDTTSASNRLSNYPTNSDEDIRYKQYHQLLLEMRRNNQAFYELNAEQEALLYDIADSKTRMAYYAQAFLFAAKGIEFEIDIPEENNIVLPCPIPSGLTDNSFINNTAINATLSWNANSQAVQYQLAGRKKDKTWKVFPPTSHTTRTFTSGILPNTTYQWSVRTICQTDTSDWFMPVKEFTTPTAKNAIHSNYDLFADVEEISDIRLYPNPAQNTISVMLVETRHTLSSDKTAKNHHLKIYNHLGQIVHESQSYATNSPINIQDLPEGSYFLQLQNDMQSIVKPFVVSK